MSYHPNYAWVGAPAVYNATNEAIGGNSRTSSTSIPNNTTD